MQVAAYEVPLPKHHWYRWPRSRGRLVSNGCHWIDYFLFLNDFADILDIDARTLRNGDVVCTLSLVNGASLTLSLTEFGSSRLNVRDIVRVATGDASATIIDQCKYESESSRGVIRRSRTRRGESFDRMYSEIGRRLAAGLPGDSLRSLLGSADAVLRAQELIDGGSNVGST